MSEIYGFFCLNSGLSCTRLLKVKLAIAETYPTQPIFMPKTYHAKLGLSAT